jgi:hypothetical protein
MGMIIIGGVIKCVFIFFLSIIVLDIVENGMQILDSDDENYDVVEVEEIIHRNSQATTILLAYLCREEYNKVNGLDNAKEIWYTLEVAHEGNLIKVTKMELIKGELGRFAMKRGEGPQEMHNRLKSLVNQVRNYGRKRWMDHEVVRLMLRSFIALDATLVSLICENPRYTKMMPKEVLGKFVSHQMMIKDAKYIEDVANRSTTSTKPQVVAFKATNEKEVIPSKVAQVEVVSLNDDEMALVIKHFNNALNGRKDYYKNKSKEKCACFMCGKTGRFIANYLENESDD